MTSAEMVNKYSCTSGHADVTVSNLERWLEISIPANCPLIVPWIQPSHPCLSISVRNFLSPYCHVLPSLLCLFKLQRVSEDLLKTSLFWMTVAALCLQWSLQLLIHRVFLIRTMVWTPSTRSLYGYYFLSTVVYWTRFQAPSGQGPSSPFYNAPAPFPIVLELDLFFPSFKYPYLFSCM